MPNKTFYVNATAPVMLISNYGTTLTGASGAITNPGANLSNLYFHSELNYIQIKGNVTAATTLTFPLLDRTLITWTDPSSKGGCFITEACVESLGLADDCYELTTLRNFRDSYMLATASDLVAEYYDNAPKVVAFIKAQGNLAAKSIFNTLYNEYVIPSVKAIEQGNLEKALELYKSGCYKAQRLAGI